MLLPTRIYQVMVNCARSFLRPLTSQQEALEWQSPPARALVTIASWRRSARTGWVKSGSLATAGSTAKSLSKSYLARQRRRPTDSARGQEEKIAFSPRGRLFEMKMDKERWQQIETLYYAALERPPDERAAFLADACGDDSGLLREVEGLLRNDSTAESFMQDNALAVAARALEPNELSQTAPQLFPGQGIGAYKILALLGRGGMGVVYRARDERLRRDVAIKVLPASLAHDADRLRRFEQEAHATSALNHPNILTIYDIGTQDGAPFIVAELLEGAELRAQLESGALTARRALEYAQQIAV